MKYLRKFNESHSSARYEDVLAVIEDALYLLEVSFDYNVDVKYEFLDYLQRINGQDQSSVCIFTIKPIGWDVREDLKKRQILENDLTTIGKMFEPYLIKEIKLDFFKHDNTVFLTANFNLLCQKCHNQKIVCPNCEGNKKVLCGCYDGKERCFNCNGQGYVDDISFTCYRCDGSGEMTCEWCNGTSRTECSECDSQGSLKCDHDWL
jgi:hypothetical protein